MNSLTPYDSAKDTLEHINNVRSKILKVVADLIERGFHHDASKLETPEKEAYDRHTPALRTLEYGSQAYKDVLAKMKPAIDHHYSVSRHHPEFFADSINGMNLIDLLEMILDWKAAGERHVLKPTDIFKSIDINAERFKMEPQLVQILKNTATYLWYE
jgi:hypothetical protein